MVAFPKISSSKNKKSFLFFLLSIVCATLAAGIIYVAGQQATPSVPVLVAKTEINAGDPLTKDMFKQVNIPPASLPDGTLTPNAPLDNAVALHGMAPGDILREPNIMRLDNKESLPILSARLRSLGKNDLRAVQIPSESIRGMLGGMKAGDRVDIISVIEKTDPEDKTKKYLESKTIIEAAPVIGVQPPESQSGGVLVVALTKQQVELFALSKEQGKIYASLVPFGINVSEENVQNTLDNASSNNETKS